MSQTFTVSDITKMPKLSEWHIYGNEQQGRFVTRKPDEVNLYYLDALTEDVNKKNFKRILDKKQYELKDHLGNVRVAIGDMKIPTGTRGVAPFVVDEKAVNDYYPYGMLISDRSWSSGSSRYGYNGKELDNELKGTGNSLDFGDRMGDPRIGGRFYGLDLLASTYAGHSPYAYAGENPILFIDFDGKGLKQSNKNNILTAKGFFSVIKKIAIEVVNDLYIKSQKLPHLETLDKNGKSTYQVKDIYGNPVTDTEVIQRCVLDFIPLAGKSGTIEKAIINGVERDLVSISSTIYKKHNNFTKTWSTKVIENTKEGFAKFKPDVDVTKIDFDVINNGVKVPNSDFYIKKMDYTIGAANGKETQYVRTYFNTNGDIHSRPISEKDFLDNMKKVNEVNKP
ncbi:MAG: hypothetical protein NTW25_09595 [Candidatus Kapabacteria bacterium]|nr:hypothetical protein [Candidatus Kapabacteria bacterium]